VKIFEAIAGVVSCKQHAQYLIGRKYNM